MIFISLILLFFLPLSSGFISLGTQSVTVRCQDGRVIFSTKMKIKITHIACTRYEANKFLFAAKATEQIADFNILKRRRIVRTREVLSYICDIASQTSQQLDLCYTT